MANILTGDSIVDEYGAIRFVNDFDFKNVKRFYQMQTNRVGGVRAWMGSKTADTYIYVPSGSAEIAVVNLGTDETQKIVLSDVKPRVMWVAPSNAFGFRSLEEKTILIFFSSETESQSKLSELKFPKEQWGVFKNE
ncbi:MAG: hypothetical protein HY398_00650 [Candidatus Doudnabacteria bacterium]|nr:hypothetical protein [Candidatus Doudnabacteria bacterium]